MEIKITTTINYSAVARGLSDHFSNTLANHEFTDGCYLQFPMGMFFSHVVVIGFPKISFQLTAFSSCEWPVWPWPREGQDEPSSPASRLSVKILCPTGHKIRHFGDAPEANLLARYGKTKPNTTKAHIHLSKEIYNQLKINTKKLKPGLVASYDIQPGNGEGLFWLALHKFLTYLQPQTHTWPVNIQKSATKQNHVTLTCTVHKQYNSNTSHLHVQVTVLEQIHKENAIYYIVRTSRFNVKQSALIP